MSAAANNFQQAYLKTTLNDLGFKDPTLDQQLKQELIKLHQQTVACLNDLSIYDTKARGRFVKERNSLASVLNTLAVYLTKDPVQLALQVSNNKSLTTYGPTTFTSEVFANEMKDLAKIHHCQLIAKNKPTGFTHGFRAWLLPTEQTNTIELLTFLKALEYSVEMVCREIAGHDQSGTL